MSYTLQVRKTLLWSDLKNQCCRKTELFVYLCGLCGCSKPEDIFSTGPVAVKNEDLFSRIRFIVKKLSGSGDDTGAFFETDGKNAGSVKPGAFAKFFAGSQFTDISRLDDILEKDCCRASAVRAFFALTGTVSAPDAPKSYIEIYFRDQGTAECCKRILASFSIKSGFSKRRDKYVCYIKNAEGVSDFLTIAGAPGESIRFQVAKTEREVSNNVNRVMNCDYANIEKSRRVSEREVLAIRKLKANGGFDYLPDDLRILAEFRLANPEMNHTELGSLQIPPVTRSAVSRKMKMIFEAADTDS